MDLDHGNWTREPHVDPAKPLRDGGQRFEHWWHSKQSDNTFTNGPEPQQRYWVSQSVCGTVRLCGTKHVSGRCSVPRAETLLLAVDALPLGWGHSEHCLGGYSSHHLRGHAGFPGFLYLGFWFSLSLRLGPQVWATCFIQGLGYGGA